MEPGEVLFSAATDPGQVFAALTDRYSVRIEPLPATRWTCLDTADWRLHDAGMSLRDTRKGRGGTLLLSAGTGTRITAPSPGRRWPQRAEGLPDSPVRERVAPAIGVRALLPLAEVEVHGLQLQVLDGEEKTRVRIEVDQLRLVGARPVALPLRVLVAPLRGYERDGARCADLLRGRLVPLGAETDATAAALAAAGHRPGEPAVPPALLDPAAPAPESLAAVLRRWIDVIDLVRPGVLADVDTEFLHELRTSVRATRSLLRLGAELMPDAEVTRFAGEFAWLGRLTAPLRDADVALLELDGFGSTDLTGLDEAGELDPLRRHLRAQRRRALTAVRSGLESPRGRALSSDWRATLDAVARRDLPAPTTRAAAAAQAADAYRRIVKAAAGVTDRTDADELHRLRGRCKRMRYLLDGYAPVYDPPAHDEVLRSLRALQNCLGEIQDVFVQRNELAELAPAMTRRGDARTVLAIGALRDRALRRDAEARRTMARRIARFRSAGTRELVAQLGASETAAL